MNTDNIKTHGTTMKIYSISVNRLLHSHTLL